MQDDPAAAEHVPWVLLAVKTHQTAGALRWLERLCGAGTVIAVLQNGVEHEALVEPLAGPPNVLPAIGWCPAEVVTPGRVRQRERARLSVPDTPLGAVLAALLGDQARVDRLADFRTEAWRKLDDETLAAVAPRVRLLVSADGLAPYTEAARRLGQRLGRDVETTPGTHAAYHDHPIEFARAIRCLLRELTAIGA